MPHRIRACLISLALIAGIDSAAAEGQQAQQEKLNLSPAKEQALTQGLGSQPTQNVPGFSGQVGSKAPASASAQKLPSNVQSQVPEAKEMLFIKLPDRIVLIDPDTQVVAEIVMTPVTTGAGTAPTPSPAPAGSPSR